MAGVKGLFLVDWMVERKAATTGFYLVVLTEITMVEW